MTTSIHNRTPHQLEQSRPPFPSRGSKRSWKHILTRSVLSTIFILMFLELKPFTSYYKPRSLKNRVISHTNSTSFTIHPPLELEAESTCPLSFFEKAEKISIIPEEAEPCEKHTLLSQPHLQLEPHQSERGAFFQLLGNLPIEGQIWEPHPMKAKILILYTPLKEPIGVFKQGKNLGDLVARRVSKVAQSIHTPQTVQMRLISCSKKGQKEERLGTIAEYIQHRKRDIHLFSVLPLSYFANVSAASLQGIAALDLLLDNRDRHVDNILVRLDDRLEALDHEYSLPANGMFDFVRLVRDFDKNNILPHRAIKPKIVNRPFWLDRLIVNRLKGPIAPEVARWVQTIDIRSTIGFIDQLHSDFLQTRLEVLKMAIQEGVALPDLYSYMTPHRPSFNGFLHDHDRHVETILHDYTTAIELTKSLYVNPRNQSDEILRATFHYYFRQIAFLRMQVFLGKLPPTHFRESLSKAITPEGKVAQRV